MIVAISVVGADVAVVAERCNGIVVVVGCTGGWVV